MGMMGLQKGRARCYTNRKRVATIARPSHSGKRPSEPIRYRDYSPERAALPLLLQLPLLPTSATDGAAVVAVAAADAGRRGSTTTTRCTACRKGNYLKKKTSAAAAAVQCRGYTSPERSRAGGIPRDCWRRCARFSRSPQQLADHCRWRQRSYTSRATFRAPPQSCTKVSPRFP